MQLYELVSDADEWVFTMELVRGKIFMEHVWGSAIAGNATTRLSMDDDLQTIDRHPALPPGPRIDRLEAVLPSNS